MFTLYLTTRLLARVMKWDKESQIEIDVFQEMIRIFGFDAIFGNSQCAVSSQSQSEGSITKIVFWMKVRVHYEHFTLEARTPDTFVLDI